MGRGRSMMGPRGKFRQVGLHPLSARSGKPKQSRLRGQ
jgi:hypothetical protein